MIYRNHSISIKSLLSIISTTSWAPLDTELATKITGYKKPAATAAFRRMIGIPDRGRGSNYDDTRNLLMIHDVDKTRVAYCYATLSTHVRPASSGHRIFWRTFPSSTPDADILVSARREICARVFMHEPVIEQPAVVWRTGAAPVLNACGEVHAEKPIIRLPPLKCADPGGHSIDRMTNDELLVKIKALRIDLETLEAERSTRLQAAADLIERLKS